MDIKPKGKNLEILREIRLWVTKVIIPAMALAVAIKPDLKDNVKKLFTKKEQVEVVNTEEERAE